MDGDCAACVRTVACLICAGGRRADSGARSNRCSGIDLVGTGDPDTCSPDSNRCADRNPAAPNTHTNTETHGNSDAFSHADAHAGCAAPSAY